MAFGAFFIAIGNQGVIAGAIPALYGFSGPNLVLGGAIHLIHGAILGVVYALIVSGTGYGHHLDEVEKSAVWGIGYGVLTTVVLAAILMPIWLSSVGFPKAPSAPNFSPIGLVGHLIYGAVLGASYPPVRSQLE
ncbi:MAG: histidine kinase [Candidatus Nanohaloarchaea archaeon]